jgi:L-alanine-DL-glutamate epimerase-like enolase superfamily enzyme
LGKLARVEVGRFDYDFVGEFKFFKPGADGIVRRPSIIVRLTDEDGFQGWGQAVPIQTWTYETPESVETTLVHYLGEAVLGVDPENIEEIHSRMNQAIYPGCSTGQPIAKAAIDIACYDLVGQRKKMPVNAILGKALVDRLQLSWTVNSMDLAVVELQLEEGKVRGYDNFNIKVGPPQKPEYDLALARKVKDYSPEGFLWADANTGYNIDEALAILPRLADAGVEVMESPLPPLNIRGYQSLKKLGAMPIFMDEGIITSDVLEEFVALEMMDGVTIKTARSGGIWPAQKIVETARDRGIQVLGSGLTDPDLSLAASVHIFAGLDCCIPFALNGPQFLGNSLVELDLKKNGDTVFVPTSPGLGVRMKPDAENFLTITIE